MDAQRETYDERMERERLEAKKLRDETRRLVYGDAGFCMAEQMIGPETKHRRRRIQSDYNDDEADYRN